MKRLSCIGSVCVPVALVFAIPSEAAVAIGSLRTSPAVSRPVGTPVTFNVTASDSDAGTLEYRFRVAAPGSPFRVVSDYSLSSTFEWTATDTEGIYQIEASVRNRSTGSAATASLGYTVTSRVSGDQPVVSATTHPLVALYSAPPCPSGAGIRVRFRRTAESVWRSTNTKACNGSTSENFYIAGMYPTTTYVLHHEVFTTRSITAGPDLTFTTLESKLADLPSTWEPGPPSATPTDQILLHSVLGGNLQSATDLNRRVIWYYPVPVSYLTRPVPGGTFLLVFGMTPDLEHSGIREIDLAGNSVRETTVARMNEQLTARGMNGISAFHHDARKLPNGHYLTLGMTERRSAAQGGTDRDIVSDMVLELDQDFQLVWAWDAFDHFDVTRPAVLNETCRQGEAGCVLLHLNGDEDAIDWTHANAVALAPDGNIIISVRHHDAVYKIAFENGTGDGHLIWKLGKDGDFAFSGGDPDFPWFSHQHEVDYETLDTISLFDNGNTRSAMGLGTESRGQVLRVDEQHRTATVILNAHLGAFSGALGAAQRLGMNRYAFTSGVANRGTDIVETDATGAILYKLTTPGMVTYRSFVLPDLYSGQSTTLPRGLPTQRSQQSQAGWPHR